MTDDIDKRIIVPKLPPVILETFKELGEKLGQIDIDPTFWDPKKPWWTENKNNHVVLTMYNYYMEFEKDDDIKQLMGPFLRMMVYLYVTNPAWRARMIWMTFFLDAYISDRQFVEKTTDRMCLESWADPRKWAEHIADGTLPMPELIYATYTDPNKVIR
jgi:hypothetical protein